MPTISGIAKDPNDTPADGVLFERQSPVVSGSNTVTRRAVRATPNSTTGAFSVTLLAGIYRYYPDAESDIYVLIEVGSTAADIEDLVTETSAPVSLITYFATLTAAKAHTRFIDDRVYAIASSASFLGGMFRYDADSSATADDSDTIALDSIAGRLIRFA
jgi:hypothetical protein